MRLSRTCYDKAHRCPGWAGGGWRFAKVRRCEGGYTDVWDYDGLIRQWRFASCNKCDVVTWPLVTRWLDPTWLWWYATHRLLWKFRDWRDEWRWRKGRV